MNESNKLKKMLIILWLVTFLPFTCTGCDYSNLGALLDVISVVASCFPGWGTVIAGVCQVIKIGAGMYGQSRAQDEYDQAMAEGRQPDYDDTTRALMGIGGMGDPGSNEDQSQTNALVTAGAQVVASGYSTYQNNKKQNSFSGGNKSNNNKWINPDTGKEYEMNQPTTKKTNTTKLDTSTSPAYEGWRRENGYWKADDLDIEYNSKPPTHLAPDIIGGRVYGLTVDAKGPNTTCSYGGWNFDPALQEWSGSGTGPKPQWAPVIDKKTGQATGYKPLKQ